MYELAPRRFAAAVVLIVGCYCVLEIGYAFRQQRVMDEFTNAYHANSLIGQIPYRDFQPPKTILGYYIEMLPLAVTHGNWSGMTAIRIELAMLWSAVLAFTAFMLRRDLAADAVVVALAMTCVMSTFAERSTEIRVDPISSMFGLLSLLALIRRRPALAGVLAAASFCSTQKGIYFSLAGGIALICVALRDRTRVQLLAPVRFGLAAVAAVAAYFAFWTAMSSPRAVFGSVLFDPSVRSFALVDLYPGIRHYWIQTLVRNPAFYAAAFGGLLLLIPHWLKSGEKAPDVIVPYATILIALCVWHKQPWPYFFVMLVPTLFVAIALALHRLTWNRALLAVMLAAALLLPIARIPVVMTQPQVEYQRAMVETGEQLLGPHDTYLDGTNMLYRHEQASNDLFWLDAPAAAAMQHKSPAELAAIIRRIDASHPKLLIWNYRMAALPGPLQAYIRSRFRPLYGALGFYSEAIQSPSFSVDFDGTYALDRPAVIDGRQVRGTVPLTKGSHALAGVASAQLALLPPRDLRVDLRFAQQRPLFTNVYDY
jgi:hypothetical protein